MGDHFHAVLFVFCTMTLSDSIALNGKLISRPDVEGHSCGLIWGIPAFACLIKLLGLWVMFGRTETVHLANTSQKLHNVCWRPLCTLQIQVRSCTISAGGHFHNYLYVKVKEFTVHCSIFPVGQGLYLVAVAMQLKWDFTVYLQVYCA
jgi:hypothetical protein